MCFYYGSLKLIIGMKLPKYNLRYNTRDLITSLAENNNDRNDIKNLPCHIYRKLIKVPFEHFN